MTWAGGDWYEGGWNEHGAHGKGTHYQKDIQRTDMGDFVSGERNGRGVMKWSNGDRYEGTWRDLDNGLQGEGTYYYANGYSERCRYVNGKWQSTGSSSYNTNDHNSAPTYDGNWLQNAGVWIWNNLMWFPWAITALLVITMLISDGFSWSLIGVCIGGGVISFIAMFVIEIVKGILKWLWNHKWLVVVVVLLILGRTIYVSNFTQNLSNRKSSVEQPKSRQPNYYCDVNTTLKVRENPRSNAREIGQLKRHEEIYVHSIDKNNFAKIDFKGGIAYVSAKYLKPKNGNKVISNKTKQDKNAAEIGASSENESNKSGTIDTESTTIKKENTAKKGDIAKKEDTEQYVGNRNSKGQRHGEGTCIWSNGDRYEGNWENDKMSGYGEYTYANGEIKNGIWDNGVYIGTVKEVSSRNESY